MEVNTMETSSGAVGLGQSQPVTLRKRSRKRTIIIFAIVCVFNVALLILIGTQLLTPVKTVQNGLNASVGEVDSPLLGKPAPAFTLNSLSDGKPVSLADFKGKPVVLNFWASWCPPCNDEAPVLQKSWTSELQQKGVVLIGIDGPEKTDADWKAFLKQYGISYPNLQDKGSAVVDYGVTSFPETIIIDRQGKVVAKLIKPLTEQAIQYEIAKIL